MIRTLLHTSAVLLCLGSAVAAQAPAVVASDKFEAEITKFDDTDRATPPPGGAVVFTGSSSIRLWTTLTADFPGVRTLNRGFGGSVIDDAVRYLDRW